MVKICAALAWCDESVDFLERCVRSLEGVVDEVIALDGAWDLFDGGPRSKPDEEEAIWRCARESGLACRVLVPQQVWASQVVKRDQLMRLAGDYADWILVVDADEYVESCDAEVLRRTLEETELDVGTVAHTNLNRNRSHGMPIRRASIRRVYRAGTTVEKAHNGYTIEGRWLHGDGAYVRLAPPVPLAACLELAHDNVNRSVERNEAAKAYRARRADQKAEVWA